MLFKCAICMKITFFIKSTNLQYSDVFQIALLPPSVTGRRHDSWGSLHPAPLQVSVHAQRSPGSWWVHGALHWGSACREWAAVSGEHGMPQPCLLQCVVLVDPPVNRDSTEQELWKQHSLSKGLCGFAACSWGRSLHISTPCIPTCSLILALWC